MGPKVIISLFVFLFCSVNAISATPNRNISLGCREAGMFSIFFDVLDLLNSYDRKRYDGVRIDFRREGFYYDSQYGRNWWHYYFEPIQLGIKRPMKRVYGCSDYVNPFEIEFHTTRHEAHRLIQKYIQLRPEIKESIDQFESTHFRDKFVIGVHYRGTDKSGEAPRVSYEKMSEEISIVIQNHPNHNHLIFVATDEQNFIHYLIAQFGDLVCYTPGTIRSTDGQAIHSNLKLPRYQIGKEALMDCLLLARTHILIRTSSNLSLCSTFFNPNLPVILLNNRWPL